MWREAFRPDTFDVPLKAPRPHPRVVAPEGRAEQRTERPINRIGLLCQEDARASCCARDEGGPFEAAL
jgi:hypothetical protein